MDSCEESSATVAKAPSPRSREALEDSWRTGEWGGGRGAGGSGGILRRGRTSGGHIPTSGSSDFPSGGNSPSAAPPAGMVEAEGVEVVPSAVEDTAEAAPGVGAPPPPPQGSVTSLLAESLLVFIEAGGVAAAGDAPLAETLTSPVVGWSEVSMPSCA